MEMDGSPSSSMEDGTMRDSSESYSKALIPSITHTTVTNSLHQSQDGRTIPKEVGLQMLMTRWSLLT